MKQIDNQQLLEQYLRKYQIADNFTADLSSYFKLLSFEPGERVTELDDYISHFYFLVKGKLRIIMEEENGKQLLLRFYNPLSVIGDLEFVENYQVKTNVEVLFPSYLIGIDFKILKEQAENDPKFLKLIIKHLGYKLYTASNTASKNQLYPLENRFASYLISISYREDETISDLKSYSLQETAMFLGTTYRHLNRVIKKLCEQKLIIKDKKRITYVIKFFITHLISLKSFF